MKKLLLATALLATGATAGNFDQMYAGVKVDYAWPTMDFKFVAADEKITMKPRGFEIDLLFGQNFQMNSDWVYGYELQIGRGLSEAKKTDDDLDATVKTRRTWKFGAAGRMGRTFNNVLVYGRLGVNATKYESKATTTTAGIAKKDQSFYAWALTPGLGAEYAISNGINARLEGTYEFGLNKSNFTWAGKKLETNKPSAFVLSAGVSFAL
jgi:opacity protein-like surface antigen